MRARAIGYAAIAGAGIDLLFSLVGLSLGTLPAWALVLRLVVSPFSIGWLAFAEVAYLSDPGAIVPVAIFAALNALLYALVAVIIWVIGPWGAVGRRWEDG